MRVTGGAAKGKRLRPPASPEARPTSARVRAAIFGILEPLGLEGARVLDLYAGSGSLGIEALSRGARWADFVERNHQQCAVLKVNLAAAGLKERARVYCTTVEKALSFLEGPYDLVFMDPPYSLPSLEPVLEALARSSLLGGEGVVVVERSKRMALKGEYEGLSLSRSRRYGDTVVDFLTGGDRRW